MTLTRRDALGVLAGSLAVPALPKPPPLLKPPANRCGQYQVPEWFRDAKFGIWAHWGPQSAPEDGDWYARNMYMQGSAQYKYHLKPLTAIPASSASRTSSRPGRATSSTPITWSDLYKKAGAKYFVSMGVHHDNFDLWNSKHTRWNAVNMGPQQGHRRLFRKAALQRRPEVRRQRAPVDQLQMVCGQPRQRQDRTRWRASPTTAQNPANADLYHEAACAQLRQGRAAMGRRTAFRIPGSSIGC